MTTSIIILLALSVIVLIGLMRFINKENRKEQSMNNEEINNLVNDAMEASRIKIELDNSIKILEKVIREREKDIHSLSIVNSSLQDNIQYQEGRVVTKEAELDHFRTMLDENAVSISALNDTIQHKDELLSEQRRKNKNLTEKIRRDANNYESRLALVQEMRAIMNSMKAKEVYYLQEIKHLKETIKNLKIDINNLELKIKRMPPRKKDKG